MCSLQVLVQTIPLRNKLLLPLPKAMFLNLDLLSEPLSKSLLLLLKLGIVELPWSCFAKLPSFHLLSSVNLVVVFFRGVNEVKHVSANKDRAKLPEITVILVLDFSDTPGILATLDNPSVRRLDILFGADDGEWHGSHQTTCVLGSLLVILLNWWLIDLDSLIFDDIANLGRLA
jgi:hypothetical protein